MRTKAIIGTIISVASMVSVATAVHAQAPAMMPITQLDAAAKTYITSNGSVIAQLGESNPDRLIGRAIPCRAGDNATFALAPSFAYPLPEGTRYVADAASRPEPLTILAQGVVQGTVGAGPLTAEANANRLTRLDISEAVRLSINTADDQGSLGRNHILFLNALNGNRPVGYEHWCVITSASVWNIRYESYDKRGTTFGLAQGLWIATANGAYTRNSTAVVPYQVVTIGITPYAASWVTTQASAIQTNAGAANPPPVSPPPVVEQPVRALTGSLTRDALIQGDRVGLVVSRELGVPIT